MQAVHHTPHDRLLVDQAQQQAGESLACPAFVRGKVTRPMVQKVAGSGVYFRVSILCESETQIQIYYPPFEDEPASRDWVFRTSDRIHRASNGKWSYVGKGGWKFNASSKGRKKRRTAKGSVACDGQRSVTAHEQAATAGRIDVHGAEALSNDLSQSESSRATHSCGSKTGSTSVVANWFDSHIRARRTLARQEGDAVLALGPAVSLSLRSQLGSSADLQSKPSSSGGQCATSACQPEATLRGSAADAPLDTVKQAATFADLKVKVANPPVHGGVSLNKGACAELESSPGGNDSRRSSSTLEAAGVESSRAESRACRVL